MMRGVVAACAVLLFAVPLAGCGGPGVLDLDLDGSFTLTAEAEAPPPADPGKAAGLPGRFLVIIAAEGMNTGVNPAPVHCNADRLGLDVRVAFRDMVVDSLERLTGGIEIADALVSPAELRQRGLAGQILVDADPLRPDLEFERRLWMERRWVAEFWHAASTAEMDMAATIHVQFARGDVVTTRVAAESRRRNADGWQWACDNGLDALLMAAQAGLAALPAEIADRIDGLSRGDLARWRRVTPDGVASSLADALADKTLDLHSTGLESRDVTDYFDRDWRMVRRDGLCETPGRWSVREGTRGAELCLWLAGAAEECMAVGGTKAEPIYLDAQGRVALATWRLRAGNAEGFGLEEKHCRTAAPW